MFYAHFNMGRHYICRYFTPSDLLYFEVEFSNGHACNNKSKNPLTFIFTVVFLHR
jgi:hypothetical protein